MGIQGLLPLMKGAESTVSLSKLQDTVAAVDTNVWIHRACYSCADRIYMGEPTEMYIHYCLNLCKILKKHRITPLLVFDGQSLPAKSETKLARQKRKEEKREEIRELLRKGREKEARWLMRQCVDVTFEMCRQVIERCRQEQIDCLVAPFEADAQITYLVNNDLADYAITEDSDLLAFGCKRALYKLDREYEKGRMIDMSRLDRCFKNMDLKKFQLMCILSGCDYISNIPGVGIGRAKKFFELLVENPTEENITRILEKLPIILNMIGKINVTKDYVNDFIRAAQTFDHQIVYSPHLDKLVHLNPLTSYVDPKKFKEYGGDHFPDGEKLLDNNFKFVTNYALGNICPKTLNILDSFIPSNNNININNNDENNESGNSIIYYSSIFNERIKKQMSKQSINTSIDNNKMDDKKLNVENCKTNNIETKVIKTINKQKYDRSIIRKRSIIEDDGIVKKSKYFNNNDNDDDFLNTKKSRPNQTIDEESKNESMNINSLSSTQTTESISTNSSSCESNINTSDLFDKLKTLKYFKKKMFDENLQKQ